MFFRERNRRDANTIRWNEGKGVAWNVQVGADTRKCALPNDVHGKQEHTHVAGTSCLNLIAECGDQQEVGRRRNAVGLLHMTGLQVKVKVTL
jgi:hypothetical protein